MTDQVPQESFGCDLFAPAEDENVIENGTENNEMSILNSKVRWDQFSINYNFICLLYFFTILPRLQGIPVFNKISDVH